MSVLGVVLEVHDVHMLVSLPNFLVGAVSIVDVSAELQDLAAKAAAAAADGSDADSDAEEEDEFEDSAAAKAVPALNALYRVGQVVACVVLQTAVEGKRHTVALSLAPAAVNAGLAPGDLIQGRTLNAAVASVEDHGYVMNIGLEGLTGFLPKKEAVAYLELVRRVSRFPARS